jgi:hypothetical protein
LVLMGLRVPGGWCLPFRVKLHRNQVFFIFNV